MNEGTVSRGVALRPRPVEVQLRFLVSKYFGFLKKQSVTFISTEPSRANQDNIEKKNRGKTKVMKLSRWAIFFYQSKNQKNYHKFHTRDYIFRYNYCYEGVNFISTERS